MQTIHSTSNQEQEAAETPILLLHKKTGSVFRHLGGTKFRNLTTGTDGELEAEKVKTLLAIPVRLNQLVMINPKLVTLIEQFNLEVIND